MKEGQITTPREGGELSTTTEGDTSCVVSPTESSAQSVKMFGRPVK